jgi:hypothetical protein
MGTSSPQPDNNHGERLGGPRRFRPGCFKLIADGFGIKEIADQLSYSSPGQHHLGGQVDAEPALQDVGGAHPRSEAVVDEVGAVRGILSHHEDVGV